MQKTLPVSFSQEVFRFVLLIPSRLPLLGNLTSVKPRQIIGDISRFEKPCQLLDYARLVPSVYQSGNFIVARTRISKRGSKLLHYALLNAAWQTTLVNKTFNYYDLKISHGRRHYGVLGYIAHKLVRVIHKMMSTNVEFNLALSYLSTIFNFQKVSS